MRPGPLAWIGTPVAAAAGQAPQGQWGSPSTLGLPLDDRGLLLGDGLFETVLVAEGRPWLLAEHLDRWRQGAALLGLPEPPGVESLAPLIREAIQRSALRSGALRLNWTRGGGGRGIDLPMGQEPALQPRFWLQLSPWQPSFQAVRVVVSQWERRHPASPASRCKTLAYGWAVQARREARSHGADDALVLNTAGELCCATTANLVLRLEGRWLTPPTMSGCLPGIMRGQALGLGLIEAAALTPSDLLAAEGGLLLNSLDCRPLLLPGLEDQPQAEEAASQLWHRCLGMASLSRS